MRITANILTSLKAITMAVLLCVSVQTKAQLNTDRLIAIGRNALYFEDYVLSIQYFNQVIKLKPYLGDPYQLRAIAKIQLGDYKGALIDCDRAIDLNPFQPQYYYTRGFIYRQLNEKDKAEQDFTKALSFAPENKTFILLRADIRAQQERYDEALEDLTFLIGREPKNASLYFEKGVICMAKKDTSCAYEAFLETVQYDSQNPSNWSALGMVELIRGEEDEALINLTKAINLGSKWPGDYSNRGIIFYHKHNYRGAIADYDKAVQFGPTNPQSYYNRGVLRAEVGDYNRALEDFNKAIDLAPEETELRYQRGLVQLQLGQWEQALEDFDALIDKYPYFLPSYYLAAQAKTALGESKDAFRYRHTAYTLEQKKDSILAAHAQNPSSMTDSLTAPSTDVHIAKAQTKRRDRRKEFSTRTAQNQQEPIEEEETATKYESDIRGSVQKKYAHVVNEPNIVLSYYTNSNTVRRTNYFHYTIDDYNLRHILPAPLYFTTQEVTLNADLINQHFEQIATLTNRINRAPTPILYIARAIEFALVQDYTSAIDDCTQAIIMDGSIAFAWFCRANWRYKLLEFQRASGELTKESSIEFEIMLRDYDYVTTLCPDFTFAYYNKANMLALCKNYDAAITHYSLAIHYDPDFAEAYFNRGLTYIYLDQVDKGIADLSKAGELGIYQAYNLITRFE